MKKKKMKKLLVELKNEINDLKKEMVVSRNQVKRMMNNQYGVTGTLGRPLLEPVSIDPQRLEMQEKWNKSNLPSITEDMARAFADVCKKETDKKIGEYFEDIKDFKPSEMYPKTFDWDYGTSPEPYISSEDEKEEMETECDAMTAEDIVKRVVADYDGDITLEDLSFQLEKNYKEQLCGVILSVNDTESLVKSIDNIINQLEEMKQNIVSFKSSKKYSDIDLFKKYGISKEEFDKIITFLKSKGFRVLDITHDFEIFTFEIDVTKIPPLTGDIEKDKFETRFKDVKDYLYHKGYQKITPLSEDTEDEDGWTAMFDRDTNLSETNKK